jgi:hypothetical protein
LIWKIRIGKVGSLDVAIGEIITGQILVLKDTPMQIFGELRVLGKCGSTEIAPLEGELR